MISSSPSAALTNSHTRAMSNTNSLGGCDDDVYSAGYSNAPADATVSATTRYFTTLTSPIGSLVITGDGESITGLYPPNHLDYERAQTGVRQPNLFHSAAQQLEEYFAGNRKDFDLPLKTAGTEFQQSVWQALKTIPYGQTSSYAAIGTRIRKPGAARAVGSANRRNPLLIFIPCHRVVAANGALSGYAGGVPVKHWLLQHERNWTQCESH